MNQDRTIVLERPDRWAIDRVYSPDTTIITPDLVRYASLARRLGKVEEDLSDTNANSAVLREELDILNIKIREFRPFLSMRGYCFTKEDIKRNEIVSGAYRALCEVLLHNLFGLNDKLNSQSIDVREQAA